MLLRVDYIVLLFWSYFRFGRSVLNDYKVAWFEDGRVYDGTISVSFIFSVGASSVNISFIKHNR